MGGVEVAAPSGGHTRLSLSGLDSHQGGLLADDALRANKPGCGLQAGCASTFSPELSRCHFLNPSLAHTQAIDFIELFKVLFNYKTVRHSLKSCWQAKEFVVPAIGRCGEKC